MAHTDRLSPNVLKALAVELGSHMQRHVSPREESRSPERELRESFRLWYLPRAALGNPDRRLDRWAINSGHWHHQIHEDGIPRFVAHSMRKRSSQRRLRSVSGGSLAGSIAAAVEWVDTHIDDDPVVRVLTAPWCYTVALWLKDDEKDRILVADMPTGFARLRKRQLYSGSEFLRAVAREMPDDPKRIVETSP